MSIRSLRSRVSVLILLMSFMLIGCGGQTADPFTNTVYIQITDTGALQPDAVPVPNGYRIVFLNGDDQSHVITWQAPLNLTATAAAGDRAWFDLPQTTPGTVVSYHLDAGGPGGTVTVISLH